MIPAFLLTRQWFDDADGIRLRFWLATDQGPLEVSIHGQRAVCFVRRSDLAAAESALAAVAGVEFRPLELATFDAEPAAAVYFGSQQGLYRGRDRLDLELRRARQLRRLPGRRPGRSAAGRPRHDTTSAHG